MMRKLFLIFFFVTVRCIKYEPTWESIDSRPLPNWYDDSKIGIFIHWGVYSVPSYGGEWFWYNWKSSNFYYTIFMKDNYSPNFTYQEFAKDFRAEFFDPVEWASLFKQSGAKYVVLTSKHHEGYTLWPSKYSFSWNSKEVGSHRDLVGELATAIRSSTDLKFGLYHSLYEWYNELYLTDKENNFTSDEYVQKKLLPELHDIVTKYKPEVVWADGAWEAEDAYWKSKEFLAWLYNESPVKDTVVTNDRWGISTSCKHGGFRTCKDRYNPGVLQDFKWENAMTIDLLSYGYRRNTRPIDYMSIHRLLKTIVKTVSCGGNILINIGPTKEGTIPLIFKERLVQMGEWLSVNGEAIYKTIPWTYQKDSTKNTWYTSTEKSVYAIVLRWPKNNIYKNEELFDLFSQNSTVCLLGQTKPLEWKLLDNAAEIRFPDKATVRSKWVWALKVVQSESQC